MLKQHRSLEQKELLLRSSSFHDCACELIELDNIDDASLPRKHGSFDRTNSKRSSLLRLTSLTKSDVDEVQLDEHCNNLFDQVMVQFEACMSNFKDKIGIAKATLLKIEFIT